MSKDKYDRQTRLWGEGQLLISSASILMLNSDCLSSEILKNLVLSGIGYMTIVDNTLTSQFDLTDNFFITPSDIGKPRSKAILSNLLELNPDDVKGEAFDIDIKQFITSSDLNKYDVFISSNLDEEINSELHLKAKALNKRLIIVKTNGLLNMIKLYENYHANMNLRLLETPVNDNRLAMPWKELIEYSDSFNLDTMDEMYHSHVPYFIILIKALQIYTKQKQLNSNNPYTFINPKTKQDKDEFKSKIKSLIKYKDETNFQEALSSYYQCNFDKTNLLNDKLTYIFSILDSTPFETLLSQSNTIMCIFFIYCKCLQEYYYENDKTFPLVGTIPDMTADTQSYITLKRIYQSKAKEDQNKLLLKINEKVNTLNLPNKEHILRLINKPNPDNEVDIINVLNKNWPQISLFKYNDNYFNKRLDLDQFNEEFQIINLKWYLLFKANDVFYMKYKRNAGSCAQFQNDIEMFSDIVKDVVNGYINEHNGNFLFNQIEYELIFEFCRNGGCKVVPCVSIIGSIASQEVIKMVTYQFETVNSVVVYDGVNVTLSNFTI